MRFQCISVQKAYFPVKGLCNALEVSTSSFYAGCKRQPCQREIDDAHLLEVFKSFFKASRQTYGSPRMHEALKNLGYQVGENELDREFTATDVNEKWVTDVTFVGTDEGWLYLAPMIDWYNREVVGWAMEGSNDTELTLSALAMALNKQ